MKKNKLFVARKYSLTSNGVSFPAREYMPVKTVLSENSKNSNSSSNSIINYSKQDGLKSPQKVNIAEISIKFSRSIRLSFITDHPDKDHPLMTDHLETTFSKTTLQYREH